MNYLYGILGAGILWYVLRGDVTVENLSDVMKKVTVNGRAYLVTRLGGGLFNVTKVDAPTNSITIDQIGEKFTSGDVAQMRSDMQRFPNELFKNS